MTAEVARGCRRLGIAAIVLLLVVPAYGQTMSEFERLSVLARARTNDGLRLPAVSAGQMANRPLLRLSLDEAVELALDQNLDIRVQRLNPLIQDLSIANVRSAWAPNLSTTFQNNSRTTPSTTQLSGGLDQINTDTFQNTVGLNQLTPWGGFYNVNWNSSNQSTTNFFTSFDPQLRSTMSLQYTQPLLRNFTIDNVRQRLQITRTNRDISDIQLRDTIVSTVRNAKNAYWELSFAISALAVQQQSLELAEESLRNNRTRVEVGTMAPIDIVEAQAEVARNEETVIVAEAAIDEAEDVLRALIMDPTTPNFWALRLEPTDTPLLQTREIDIDAAVASALAGRTDLAQIRRSLDNTDTNIRFYQNQRMPDVNLQVNYSATAAGGTELIREGRIRRQHRRHGRYELRLGPGQRVHERFPHVDGRPHHQLPDRHEQRRCEPGAVPPGADPDRGADPQRRVAGSHGGSTDGPERQHEPQAGRCHQSGPPAGRGATRSRAEEVRRWHVHQLPRVPGPARSGHRAQQ